MFNIAICDDEYDFVNKLAKMIFNGFNEYNFEVAIHKFTSGKNMIKQIEFNKKRYDLIFLDIEMPELDGFSVADKINLVDKSANLVFTTNSVNYAKKAFEYEVFRFIDKYCLVEDLKATIWAFIRRKGLDKPDDLMDFVYKVGIDSHPIQVRRKDIIYFEIVSRRVKLHTVHGEYELQTYTLKTYFEKLKDDGFAIVNRKYCVNFLHVTHLNGDYFKMSNSESISVGSSYKTKEEIKVLYGKYRKNRV